LTYVPARPYSPWRRAGDLVIVSGQLGTVAGKETTTFAEGGAPGQLRQALKNAASLLEEAGSSLADVVKATMFIVDMSDFTSLNEVWLDVFSGWWEFRKEAHDLASVFSGKELRWRAAS
jgi:2-iminobutanoate/2-iminopropanoate deaminase